MFGIQGRSKGNGKFKSFDYKNGCFVINTIYQTLWENEQHVEKLIQYLNDNNTDFEFKIIKRG